MRVWSIWRRLADPGERSELVAFAVQVYGCGDAEALERLRAAPYWPPAGGPPRTAQQMVAVKTLTSELIARLVRAAVDATTDRYGRGPLRRYRAELVVPDDVRAECAVLKAITARWVMGRAGAAALQERQRELLTELAAAIAAGAPGTLEAMLAEAWHGCDDDAARRRVVVDQVARLTDLSAVRWHARLVRRRAQQT